MMLGKAFIGLRSRKAIQSLGRFIDAVDEDLWYADEVKLKEAIEILKKYSTPEYDL